MSTAAELTAVLKGQDAGMGALFDDTKQKATGLGKTLGDVGKIAGGFLAAEVIGKGVSALKDGIGSSIAAASDFNESLSKTRVVFGDSSKAVEEFASTSAKNLGLSRGAALEATSTFGNFLQALGTARAPATDMSIAMVKLAGDLASFNNASPEEVLLALRSGLSGEAEPMRRFGVAISETAVSAKAMELGIKGVGGQLSEAQKIQLRYQIIMDQTKTAQGDFARTSDGLANTQRIAAASMEDLKTKIGQGLLPVQLALTTFMTGTLIPAIISLIDYVGPQLGAAIDFVKGPIGAIGGAFGAILPTLGAFGQYILEIVRGGDPLNDFLANLPAPLQGIALTLGGLVPTLLSFGQGLVTIGGQVVGIVSAIVGWVQETNLLNTALAGLATIFAGLSAAAAVLWPLIKQVADFFVENKIAAYALVAVLGALVVALAPIPLAIAGIILAVGALSQHWDDIKAKAEQVWGSIPGPIKAALDAIYQNVRARIDGVIQVFRGMYEIITGIVDLVVDLFHGRWSQAWDDLKKIATGVVDTLLGTMRAQFGSIPEIILGAAGNAAAAAVSFGRGIADGIGQGIKAGINWIIDAVNKALDFVRGIHISIPSVSIPGVGKVGGSTLDIPGVPGNIGRLASGTNFWRGGLTMLGENGPELAYLPRGAAVAPNGAGFGGTTVIINGPVYGIADLDARIRKAVRDGYAGGAFRGVA